MCSSPANCPASIGDCGAVHIDVGLRTADIVPTRHRQRRTPGDDIHRPIRRIPDKRSVSGRSAELIELGLRDVCGRLAAPDRAPATDGDGRTPGDPIDRLSSGDSDKTAVADAGAAATDVFDVYVLEGALIDCSSVIGPVGGSASAFEEHVVFLDRDLVAVDGGDPRDVAGIDCDSPDCGRAVGWSVADLLGVGCPLRSVAPVADFSVRPSHVVGESSYAVGVGQPPRYEGGAFTVVEAPWIND